jgi:glycosyltransferase involved in cell wall biosynthesis
MKLLFTNFHDGDGGGHTTYLAALAGALAQRHQVHVAAPAGSRLLREAGKLPGVTVFPQAFPNGLAHVLARQRALRELAGYIARHAFDIVHVNGSADHRLVTAALHGLARRPRIVLTKHNSKPVGGIGHALRARHTDQVIAVSAYTRDQLSRTVYARRRLDIVRNGIDVDRFAPWSAAAAQHERRRWAGDAALLLGSTAGTAPYKGWMDLVEALALLPAWQRVQVHVLLAGKPPAQAQRERIDQLGLAGQLHFAGLLDDVRPVIAAIDAGFVLSYDVETISFACREMMAMAKPVLLTDYAGLPENITVGRDGWLVPVRDPPAIAKILQHMLAHREELPAMGEAARARAVEDFGIERFVTSTEAVYAGLLAGRH